MDRYYPLIDYKDTLISYLKDEGIVFRDKITEDVIKSLAFVVSSDIAHLFARFLHIYDFKKGKLREIRKYYGTEKFDTLANLLRLPGVRVLRAELYYSSGLNIESLSCKTTEEIQNTV